MRMYGLRGLCTELKISLSLSAAAVEKWWQGAMAKNDMANQATGIESAAVIEAMPRSKAQKVMSKVGVSRLEDLERY